MPASHYLKIVSFGLIGEAQKGDSFRHVLFEDTVNNQRADFLVYKKKRPGLWSDIEEMEKGKTLPPYKGYITRYNGIDLVVFGDESIEEAFAREKWKLELTKRISYNEAELMREESKGYCTNETRPGAIEIGWRKIDQNAQRIRFRYYEGRGVFSWSPWHEIVGKS